MVQAEGMANRTRVGFRLHMLHWLDLMVSQYSQGRRLSLMRQLVSSLPPPSISASLPSFPI